MNTLQSRIKQRAFTLVELLIALAIFALISAAAYRALDLLISARAQTERATAELNIISTALQRLENDVQVALPRSRIGESGAREPAFYAPQNSSVISWTRAGFAGAGSDQPEAAAPQRVGFRLQNGIWEFLLWPRLDSASRLTPEVTPLMEQVQSVRWRFWSSASGWQERWPLTSDAAAFESLPALVEITLIRNNGEQLQRLIPILARSP